MHCVQVDTYCVFIVKGIIRDFFNGVLRGLSRKHPAILNISRTGYMALT